MVKVVLEFQVLLFVRLSHAGSRHPCGDLC